jgi:hypothetical protein
MALYQSYTWTYQLQVPPYEKLMAVLEAFFASYPRGDYACEVRDTYKLEFRRGQWKRLLGFGPLAPARLTPGEFEQWPILLRVLTRPSPEAFLITVRYELHLPRAIKALHPQVQASFSQHAMRELADLAEYLAQCIQMPDLPRIEAK